MIKFATYLVESEQVAAAFLKAKKALPADQRFGDAMDQFANAANKKEIYNAQFKDLYSYRISRGVEKGWDNLRAKHHNTLKAVPGDDAFWGITMQNVKKAHALYSKHNVPADVMDFLNHVVDLPDAIKQLKTYVKMGKPPKQTTNTLDIAKAAVVAKHDVDPTKLLQDVVATFKAELHVDSQKSFASWYDKLKGVTSPKDIPDIPGAKSLATMIFITRSVVTDEGKRATRLELKPDAEMIMHKLADRMVNDIIEEFVAKNTRKLALIFKKKGDPDEHRIVRTTVRNNTLENTMFFKFSDSSSFNIESTVVVKYTQTGKPYMQMPTRFRNVVMADGSNMSQPSEEKMLRSF